MKKLFLLFGWLCLCVAVKADIRSIFVEMPDLFLLTEKNARLDLIDYYQSGLRSTVKGLYGNTMEIKEMTDDYLRLSLGNHCDYQFKLLPCEADTLLLTVQTVYHPVPNSVVLCYSTSWKLLQKQVFPAHLNDSLSALSPMRVYTLFPDNQSLQLTVSALPIIEEQKQQETSKQSLLLQWNGSVFTTTESTK